MYFPNLKSKIQNCSCKFLEQGSCFFQVGGVKPFRKPPVDVPEQLPGFGHFTLPLPKPTQAHRGAKLQRLRMLATGYIQCVFKAGFGLFTVGDCLTQE
jgi:hypothetical protein